MRLLVASDVFVALDIGGHRNIDRCLVGSYYADVSIAASYPASFGINGQTPHEANLSLQSLMLSGDAMQVSAALSIEH